MKIILWHFFQNKTISPETIRRRRQKFQMDGKYRATEEIEEQRYKLFERLKVQGNKYMSKEITELKKQADKYFHNMFVLGTQ